ncbi:MAG: Hsp20/alpha crystallin family protein [Verrucomicrobiota bacterium]
MKLIRYEYPQTPAATAFDRFFNTGASSIERFGSLLDDFLGQGAAVSQPAVDLYEDDQNYYARLELPGVKKDAIDIELENAVLTVSSSQEEESGDSRRSVSFQRSISVPDGIDAGKVSAKLEDGVLTITLPKEETRKPRQISVK